MRSRFRRKRDGKLRRRLIAAVSLAAYLLASTGVPVTASFTKQHGAAFPCQQHACGCASAQECWEHCCCYSPRQKLAWALEHGIDPPERLIHEIAALDAEALHEISQTSRTRSSCCAKEAGTHADHAKHADKACGACHDEDSPDDDVTFVPGVNARHCRGLGNLWCISGAVAPTAIISWHYQWNVVEWLASRATLSLAAELDPPVPPPRV